MHNEPDMALRRRVTDSLVLSLHLTGNVRWRADLAGIRTFGIEEKTAADVADRLAGDGLLNRADSACGDGYFRLTEEGREALATRYRQTAA